LLEKGRFHVNISIDSLEKENYEKIRVNAKFEKVMENIEYFHKYCKEKKTFFGISVCAIRQNWKEIPAFVDFCNKLEAPIYIHSVWFPPSCSLWNLGSVKLDEILSFMGKFTFPEENDIQKKNSAHYLDFVSLIESWLNKAKTAEKEISLEDQDLKKLRKKIFENIRIFIDSKENLDSDQKKEQYTSCIKKLVEALKIFDDKTMLERALRQMVVFPSDMLVPELISASGDRIYEEIRSFIFNLD